MTALAAAGLWTLGVLAWLLLGEAIDPTFQYYWAHPVLCTRLVGHSAACDAQQALVNDAWWQYHLLPMYLAIVSGYAAVAVTWIVGHARRATRTRSRHSDAIDR